MKINYGVNILYVLRTNGDELLRLEFLEVSSKVQSIEHEKKFEILKRNFDKIRKKLLTTCHMNSRRWIVTHTAQKYFILTFLPLMKIPSILNEKFRLNELVQVMLFFRKTLYNFSTVSSNYRVIHETTYFSWRVGNFFHNLKAFKLKTFCFCILLFMSRTPTT